MQYKLDMDDGVVRVVLNGKMDYSDQTAFKELTKVISEANGPVVIDVSEVVGADTAALGFLVLAADKAKENGVDFQVANPQPSVRLLMQSARLDRQFEIS